MPIYHLIIECCLELMHLRSSVLLLVVVIDGLQVTDDHSYDTRQLPPLFLCCPLLGRASEYGKFFSGASFYSCPEILIPSYLLWGDFFIK